jgi:ADP-ribose pyrophosphatase
VTELVDSAAPGRTLSTRSSFRGAVWSVRTDSVDLGDAGVVERDVVEHPGAVAVLALDDDARIVLVRQYRHPVASYLWELPAGLRDVAGEAMHVTAARELEEEAGLRARRWHTLLDLYKSSGGSSERMRIFLARDLEHVPAPEGFVATGEEATLEVARFPSVDVVSAVLSGRVHNAALVAGALALAPALDEPERLRSADAPWIGDSEVLLGSDPDGR